MMDADRERRAAEIFADALEIQPEGRREFVRRVCAGDDALLGEVESLLEVRSGARALFARPLTPSFAEEPSSPDIGRQLGPYILTAHLASGGMGSVYLAERMDQEFRSQVAVKLIRAGMGSGDILNRFRNERQILADLQHPNIARLLDGGSTSDGIPYMVMEYVDGRPIDRHSDDTKLPIARRVELFLQVCEAVQYAHRHLVVHRDLKPSNVFVDRSGRVKLLDFGIAKVLDPDPASVATDATATALRMLTPRYASPEQIQGLRTTTSADIYSLGVILYELLCGDSPFKLVGKSLAEVERAVTGDAPTRPSRAGASRDPSGVAALRQTTPRGLVRELEGDLDTILLRALAKEPERRYPTVEEFASDLRRHLTGLPVMARPDTALYRVRKFAGRNRPLVAAVVTAFVLLSGSLVATFTAYRQAVAQKREAEWLAYVNAVGAAESELLLDKVGEAAFRLDGAPPHLRGWEWRHLHSRLDQSLRGWQAHDAGITDLSFAADGVTFASSSLDGTVKLWDVRSADLLQEWGPFAQSVESIAIHPADGSVVAGLNEGTVLCLTRGRTSADTLFVGDGPDLPKSWPWVAIRPDGAQLAVGFLDGWVLLWDHASGVRSSAWRAQPNFAIPQYTPDGKFLAIGGQSGLVRIWKPGSWPAPPELEFQAHSERMWNLAFSHDGTRLVTASMDRTAAVWDWKSAKLLSVFRGHEASANSAVFAPGDDVVVSAGADGKLVRWDAASGELRGRYRGHAADVTALAFGGDTQLLVSGDWSGIVKVWDWQVEEVPTVQLRRHGRVALIRDAAFDPTTDRLLCARTDEHVSIIETVPGEQAQHHFAPILLQRIAWDRAGRWVVGGTDSGELALLDPSRFREWAEGRTPPELRAACVPRSIQAHTGAVLALRRVPNDDLFATAASDSVVRFWRTPELRMEREFRIECGPVHDIEFSPDGTAMALGVGDGTIRILRVSDGREITRLVGHERAISDLAWSPDGRLLASASPDGTARVWDMERGTHRSVVVRVEPALSRVAWSSDGSRLAVGGSDEIVRLIDAHTDRSVIDLHGHVGRIQYLEFVRNDRALLSAASDGSVRVWNAPDPREPHLPVASR